MTHTRVVTYGTYDLPNVMAVTRAAEPREINRNVVAWNESFTIKGLLQADTNALFQTAKDAFEAAIMPTNLDQIFTIKVNQGVAEKTRFSYDPASANAYRRAKIRFTYDGGPMRTELSYPYTVTFSFFPPNLTGAGNVDVENTPTVNQKIFYAVDSAGYISITKRGTVMTPNGTSAKDWFEDNLETSSFLELSGNTFKRSSYNYDTDELTTECRYVIIEVETPVRLDDFDDLSIGVTSQEQDGLVIMHGTADGRIDKSKFYGNAATTFAMTNKKQYDYRVKLEAEIKKIFENCGLAGYIIDRRDPIEWNPQTGRIRVGIHMVVPMTGWILSYQADMSVSSDDRNEFAATNDGWVDAVDDPPIERRTYSGNLKILAPSESQALTACKPGYPDPSSARGEVREGPLTFSKPQITQVRGDGSEATCSWSITYRSTNGIKDIILNRDAASWTGLAQGHQKYI